MGRGKSTFTLATDKRSAWARYGPKTCMCLEKSKRLYSSCQADEHTWLLWRYTEAYCQYVDLARFYRRALLNRPGLSERNALKSSVTV